MPKTYFNPLWVKGRSITRVELNPQTDENGVHHDPVIYLDNGASISFMVTESNHGGFYGISPIYRKAS